MMHKRSPAAASADSQEPRRTFELTPEQLREWAETGELPALDEWLAESRD
jgi:hypothetical protein